MEGMEGGKDRHTQNAPPPPVARPTQRINSSISSKVTSLVSFMPMATMAKLSPTNIMSMPAASATSAEGKSCAVSMVMGIFFACRLRRVFRVTGLRFGVPSVGAMGLWEE